MTFSFVTLGLPSEMRNARLEDSHWEEMHISLWEDRAFLLRIVQCYLGEVEFGPRLPRPADGQLKENVIVNVWRY